MCGDATARQDVAALFDGVTADIVVTSPPYADCRDYLSKIPCWDTLMVGAFGAIPCHESTQLLVNLGVIHRKNEWVPYWWGWLQQMRAGGWRHYSLYVWDKLRAVPGGFGGRLKPAHEFIFHLNKKTVQANAWQPTKHEGHTRAYWQGVRAKNGMAERIVRRPVAATKVPNSVVRHVPILAHEAVGHPAQYPAGFADFIVKSWGTAGGAVYDPFAGTCTTLIAAQQNGRLGYAMEIAPEYVSMALSRWAKAYSDHAPVLASRRAA